MSNILLTFVGRTHLGDNFNQMCDAKESAKPTQEKRDYEKPTIVYESVISTRAGSPIIGGDAPAPPEGNKSIDLFPES